MGGWTLEYVRSLSREDYDAIVDATQPAKEDESWLNS
jgi:hypothetical protein